MTGETCARVLPIFQLSTRVNEGGPGAAWFDEEGLRFDLSKRVSDDPGSHLRAIVGTDVGRDA